MMKNGIKYLFSNITDMIKLAQEIQTCVYWGWTFFEFDDEECTHIPYKEFWDMVETSYEDGCIGVIIAYDRQDVEFIRG